MDTELLDPSDSNWIPWVKHQLTRRKIFAVAVDMPKPYEPDYALWRREFERHDITHRTSLVGHSAGGAFLLRWLGENPNVKVYKTAIVAPWLDPNKKYGDFCDFEIDTEITRRCLGGLAILYDPNDDIEAQRSAATLRKVFPERAMFPMPGFGHFMVGNKMYKPEFPELLDKVL